MSILSYKSFIGGSSGLGKSKSFLTKADADIFYAKTNGNVFFNNQNVLGTSTTSDAVINDDIIVNDSLTVSGVTNLNGSLMVANVFSASTSNGLSYTYLPRLQSTITPSDSKDLVTKQYSDDRDALKSNLSGGNTFTGTQNMQTVSVGSGGLVVENVMSASTSGGLSYTFLPRLQSQIMPTDSKDLVTKQYTDSAVAGMQSFNVALRTTFGVSAGNYNTITPPNIGGNTSAGTSNFQFNNCFINLPSVNICINHIAVKFDYCYTVGASMSGLSLLSGNTLQQIPSFQAADFKVSSISNAIQTTSCVFFICIATGGITGNTSSKLVVKGSVQSSTVWNNSTNAPALWTNSYDNVAISWNPIQFTYVNEKKIQVSINAPNQLNRPDKAGWISSISSRLEIINTDFDVGSIGAIKPYLTLT